jgi:hypothetical protein
VVELPKARVCGPSLTGTAGSNPAGAWMSVSCKCCVLPGRVLCDGPIARPEESYRLWCAIVCDLGTSRMRRPGPALARVRLLRQGGEIYDLESKNHCARLQELCSNIVLNYLPACLKLKPRSSGHKTSNTNTYGCKI